MTTKTKLVVIDVDSYSFTDGLFVRFYVCERCGYARVPYGAGYTEGKRANENDARFCPGCGEAIAWKREVQP